jgi:hypothetical protein
MALLIYQIFQSSSCVRFNNFFAALYAREEADVMLYGPTKRLPTETLFRIAEHQYRTMLEDGTWTIVGKKVSSFNAEGNTPSSVATTGSDKLLPPYKIPPALGEPHQREFKGRLEYWCTRCGWNRSHLVNNRKTKGELKAALEKGNAATLTGTPAADKLGSTPSHVECPLED